MSENFLDISEGRCYTKENFTLVFPFKYCKGKNLVISSLREDVVLYSNWKVSLWAEDEKGGIKAASFWLARAVLT